MSSTWPPVPAKGRWSSLNVDWNALKPKHDMANENAAYLLTQMKAGKIISARAMDIAPPASGKVPMARRSSTQVRIGQRLRKSSSKTLTTAPESPPLPAITYGAHASLRSRRSSYASTNEIFAKGVVNGVTVEVEFRPWPRRPFYDDPTYRDLME